ncbi:MAG: DUF2178 domain-containing protein [Methanomicrobium sp.]|nr:DUF2178 domain-containing protein [Methanomicrobium sp.]
MEKKTYNICLAAITASAAIAMIFGLRAGSLITPIVIIAAGIIAAYLCYRRVDSVTTDDLTETINGKAALKAVEIMILISAVAFLCTTTFYYTGGWGSGMKTYDDGSIYMSFMQFYPAANPVYMDSITIPNPDEMTDLERGRALGEIEDMFVKGHNFRDYPLVAGVTLGFVTIILTVLYASFSYYYNRKYGCNDNEE